jgi:integrase
VSARRSPAVLSRREAGRILKEAQSQSAQAGLVVGLALVSGWRISEVARRLRGLRPGVTR